MKTWSFAPLVDIASGAKQPPYSMFHCKLLFGAQNMALPSWSIRLTIYSAIISLFYS